MTQTSSSLHIITNETPSESKWHLTSQMLTIGITRVFHLGSRKQSTSIISEGIKIHIVDTLHHLTGDHEHCVSSRVVGGTHCLSIKDDTNTPIMNLSLQRKSVVNPYDALNPVQKAVINGMMRTMTLSTPSKMYGDVSGTLRYENGNVVSNGGGIDHTNASVNLGALLAVLTKLKYPTPI